MSFTCNPTCTFQPWRGLHKSCILTNWHEWISLSNLLISYTSDTCIDLNLYFSRINKDWKAFLYDFPFTFSTISVIQSRLLLCFLRYQSFHSNSFWMCNANAKQACTYIHLLCWLAYPEFYQDHLHILMRTSL